MIGVEHVSKRYGRQIVLRDVSFELRPGEVTLLSGAKGAGKSTLLRCLLGITDYGGVITVAGLDPRRHGSAVQSLTGYMPQTSGLHPDLTVADTMRLYAEIRAVSCERAMTLLHQADLSTHLLASVGSLSRGMRQRLGFALALLMDPAILILDEPGASLDSENRAWLARRLHELAREGRTVLVTADAEQEPAGSVDRRLVLEDGRCSDPQAAATRRPSPRAAESRAPRSRPSRSGPDPACPSGS